jgi:Protein of unknown function (DUF3106)
MNGFPLVNVRLWIGLGCCGLAGAFLTCASRAQTAPPDKAQISSKVPPNPPAIPSVSPVKFFRELLAMDEAARAKALAGRTPRQIKVLKSKLVEYESMPAEERELRLRQLELFRYVVPLMRLSQAQRVEPMARLPEKDRAIVTLRLQEWDRLTLRQQTNIFNNKTLLSYFVRPERPALIRRIDTSKLLPPGYSPQKLETTLSRWRNLDAEGRRELRFRLDRYFEMTESEREKVLDTLSPKEKELLEKTLNQFGGLSPEQQARCLEGFSKLAQLPPEERRQFILDADRWQSMTPEQRSLWRRMIHNQVEPPLPPGRNSGPAATGNGPLRNDFTNR